MASLQERAEEAGMEMSWHSMGKILSIVCLLFISTGAFGAELSIPYKKWDRPEVLYFVDKPSCPKLVLDQFPSILEEPSRFIKFLDGGMRRTIGYDGMPTIFCDKESTRLGSSSLVAIPDNIVVTEYNVLSETRQPVVLATTRVYSSLSGSIIDADIWIDTDYIHESNIKFVLRHELGHLLGLPHSENEDALMYWKPTRETWHITDYATLSLAYNCVSQLDSEMNEYVLHSYGKDWLYIIKFFNGAYFTVEDYGILTDADLKNSGCRTLIRR